MDLSQYYKVVIVYDSLLFGNSTVLMVKCAFYVEVSCRFKEGKNSVSLVGIGFGYFEQA